jgi:hypothetical protein
MCCQRMILILYLRKSRLYQNSKRQMRILRMSFLWMTSINKIHYKKRTKYRKKILISRRSSKRLRRLKRSFQKILFRSRKTKAKPRNLNFQRMTLMLCPIKMLTREKKNFLRMILMLYLNKNKVKRTNLS